MTAQPGASAGSERMLEIGEKLAAVRKAKGMTQVQVSRREKKLLTQMREELLS